MNLEHIIPQTPIKLSSASRQVALFVLLAMSCFQLSAQNMSVNATGAAPDSTAMLDVSSTSKGVLIPRMTQSQRLAISNPAYGLMVMQSDNNKGLYIYDTAGAGSWGYVVDSAAIANMLMASSPNLQTVLGNGNDAGADSILNLAALGIGTSTPVELLEVNGKAQIDTLSINGAFAFPSTSGTSGQVLQVDGLGVVNWVDVGTDTLSILQDADKNTKIQLEETSNEDIIRFDLGGTEFLQLDSGRIYTPNTGQSVFLGEGAGANDDLTTNANVMIGYNAGNSNTSSISNVAIGGSSMSSFETGSQNVAVGRLSSTNLEQGVGNVSIGYFSQYNMDTGSFNTGIGVANLRFNTNGSANTAVGYFAGVSNTGDGNVFLGYRAGGLETGSNTLYIDNSNSSDPLIYGDFSADSLRLNGALVVNAGGAERLNVTSSGNVGIGTSTPAALLEVNGKSIIDTLNINNAFTLPSTNGTNGQVLQADGTGAVNWVNGGNDTLSIIQDADRNTKIQVEESSNEDTIRFDIAGTEYWRMGPGRLEVMNTGKSLFMGRFAGQVDNLTTTENVFLGDSAGMSNVMGAYNTFVGVGSGKAANSFQNTAFGNGALRDLTTGANNVAVGDWAIRDGDGTDNVAVGSSALVLTNGSENVAIGAQANAQSTTAATVSHNVVIGRMAGLDNTGSNNVLIGYQVGQNSSDSNRLMIDNSNTSTPLIYGDFANDSLKVYGTLGVGNAFAFPTTDGSNGQYLQTNGSGVVSWASATSDTLSLIQDADRNTKIQVEESSNENIIRFDIDGTEYWRMEQNRLVANNTGMSIFIGDSAGSSMSTGDEDVFVGYRAGKNQTGGNANTFIGSRAGEDVTSGFQNVALGLWAYRDGTSGGGNVALGSEAMLNVTTGSENIAIGQGALSSGSSVTGLDGNIAIGLQAGSGNTGDFNVFLGYQAGLGASGSNQLYIDNSGSSQPLIYGDFASDSLSIFGTLQVDAGGSGDAVLSLEADEDNNNETDNPFILMSQDGGTNTGYIGLEGNDNQTATNTKENSMLVGTPVAERLQLITNGAVRMTFADDGKVGIGTNAPPNELSLHDSTGSADFDITTTNSGSTANLYLTNTLHNYRIVNDVDGKLRFQDETNSASRMIIDSTGRVGIGATTNPTELLDVSGKARIDTLDINGNFTLPSIDGNNGEYLTTDGSGNVSWASASGIFTLDSDTISAGSGNQKFVFGSTNTDDLSGTGDDYRMFYDKATGAFRAGEVGDVQWNADSLGTASTAFGHDTRATGSFSFAAGDGTWADGNRSVAIGRNSIAKGGSAIAIGASSYAGTGHTVVLGQADTALGSNSIAIGGNAYSGSDYSIAIGHDVTSVNQSGVAIGDGAIARGQESYAIGQDVIAQSMGEIVLGYFNDTLTTGFNVNSRESTERLLVIGNATNSVSRSNALVMLKNGNTTLNGQLTMSSGGSSITLPNTDGSEGQVLKTNGSGAVTFGNGIALSDGDNDTKVQVEKNDDEDHIRFDVAGTEAMVIDGSGNVGIGTSTPASEFELFNNTVGNPNNILQITNEVTAGQSLLQFKRARNSQTQVLSADGLAVIDFKGFDGSDYQSAAQILAQVDANTGSGDMPGNLQFYTTADGSASPAERMRIDSDGDVGIGDSTPDYLLDIEGSEASDPLVTITNSNSGFTAGGIEIQLGIGTPINANHYIEFKNGSGSTIGSIAGTGLGGTSYATTSDRRLKTNIEDLPQGLALIDRMRPRQYERIAAPGKHEFGFIAQELQTVLPQVVAGDSTQSVNENPMQVDYSKLTPVLTAGVKELHTLVKDQQTEIQGLKASNAEMEAELKEMRLMMEKLMETQGVEPNGVNAKTTANK